MSDDPMEWAALASAAYAAAKAEVDVHHWHEHPLTGYMRAQARIDGLLTAMSTDPDAPRDLMWDARTVRAAIERLEPRARVNDLIRDARWTINTRNASSHRTEGATSGAGA